MFVLIFLYVALSCVGRSLGGGPNRLAVDRTALRWTEPPSKESYQVSKHKVQKLQEEVAYSSKKTGKERKG
jgi:hypothetical protein